MTTSNPEANQDLASDTITREDFRVVFHQNGTFSVNGTLVGHWGEEPHWDAFADDYWRWYARSGNGEYEWREHTMRELRWEIQSDLLARWRRTQDA